MKLTKIKITALVLALFTAAALVWGCGDNNAPDSGNVPVNGDDDGKHGGDTDSGDGEHGGDEGSGSSIEARPDYELPEKNFGGYDFRVISKGETVQHWWNYEIDSEEETGEPVEDAVHHRNRKIEELYNIKIVNIPDGDVGGRASRSIRAGSDDYDLVVTGLVGGQENLTTQGSLMDLHAMPFVDLTRPWWDQKAVEQLSINGKLFATSCDITVRDKDAIIILMFSKTLVQNHALEDPYGLVLSGNWTLDKMHDMMKIASKDLDGDGKMDLDDQYGFLTQYKHALYLFNAAGEYVSKLNSNKTPEITMYSERAAQVVEKIAEIHGDKNITIHAEQASGKFTDIWDVFQVPMFAEDRALFYHAGMNRVTLLRTMETDFGILPPPKFDSSQKDYFAAVDAWCTSSVSVPVTVEDKERTGLILETLTYESRYILLPAYYDINLKTKFARDEESSAMIDIILANRLYDLGEIYAWGDTVSYFNNLAQGRDESLATYWEKNSGRINTAMQKTMERIDALE